MIGALAEGAGFVVSVGSRGSSRLPGSGARAGRSLPSWQRLWSNWDDGWQAWSGLAGCGTKVSRTPSTFLCLESCLRIPSDWPILYVTPR